MNPITLDNLSETLRNEINYQNLTAGEMLFNQGDEAIALFAVETGRIKLVRYISEEKIIPFEIVRKGEFLGEIALFSDTYTCVAIADVASRVIVYPKQQLLSVFRQSPDLAEEFIAILIGKIQSLKFRLELLNIREAHERLLLYLQHLAKLSEERTVNLDRPLKNIASELSITPETLSRALLKLERERAITRRGSIITLYHFSET